MLLVTIDLASESLPYFLAFQATVMKFEPYIQFLDITSTVNLNELKHYFLTTFLYNDIAFGSRVSKRVPLGPLVYKKVDRCAFYVQEGQHLTELCAHV